MLSTESTGQLSLKTIILGRENVAHKYGYSSNGPQRVLWRQGGIRRFWDYFDLVCTFAVHRMSRQNSVYSIYMYIPLCHSVIPDNVMNFSTTRDSGLGIEGARGKRSESCVLGATASNESYRYRRYRTAAKFCIIRQLRFLPRSFLEVLPDEKLSPFSVPPVSHVIL